MKVDLQSVNDVTYHRDVACQGRYPRGCWEGHTRGPLSLRSLGGTLTCKHIKLVTF